VVSVDRLDYTKGFEERLAAVERLLETAGLRRSVAFLQIAAPTRVAIDRYAELADRVRTHVARINRRFGDRQSTPVTYVERYLAPADVFRCYRAADVCYVGSLDDGMNLVAKEFVTARDDERGALVLSRFAGAAQELTDALIVNPYDIDGVADALARALDLPGTEQQSRMRRMRLWIAQHHIYRWAGQMLADATHVRQAAYDHAAPVKSSQQFFPAHIM
jgi:trehalose 6-phosphate synthase